MANGLMILGTKESFLIRSLMKKLKEGLFPAFYVEATVDNIAKHYDEADMLAIYFDTNTPVPQKVMIYLKEKMLDDQKKLFLIGERIDIEGANAVLPPSLITTVFERPLNPDSFLVTARLHLETAAEADRKKSILIVDDDPTYIGLVREWLRAEYKVAMANSGAQALRYLGQNMADLILLDFEMPVVAGPEVLKMLRSDPDTARIPVIFLTGKQDRDSVMQVVALKPEGYLLKTISREDLLLELKKFFMNR